MSGTKSRETKTKRVLSHLLSGKSITPLRAFDLYKTMRLADIIYRLKGMGYDIQTTMRTHNGTTFASYKLD